MNTGNKNCQNNEVGHLHNLLFSLHDPSAAQPLIGFYQRQLEFADHFRDREKFEAKIIQVKQKLKEINQNLGRPNRRRAQPLPKNAI